MTTASTGALPAPPERPGWWRVVVAVFFGYVCAAFALFGLALLAVLLGLVALNEPKFRPGARSPVASPRGSTSGSASSPARERA